MAAKANKSSKSQSFLVQYRWNKGTELGSNALEALELIQAENPDKPTSEIMAYAIMQLRGLKLPKRTVSNAEIIKRLDTLETRIEQVITNALQGIDLSQYVREDGQTMAEELGERLPTTVYNEIMRGVQGKKFEIED